MSIDFLSLGDGADAAELGGGANTTLAADVAAGSLTIEVAAATAIADGDYLRIGDAGETEIRQVAVSGVSGTTITLAAATGRAHDSGDQVREMDGPGTGNLLEDLWDATFSGFAYPARKTELKLIGNGTDAGNVVVQESAKGFREASLAFTAQNPTERDVVRGWDESSATVTFTDYDGSTCDVQVLDFSSSSGPGVDLWTVTVRLLQLTDPVGP